MGKLRRCVVVTAVVLGFGASFAMAQTTVAGSVYGAFRSSTSANGTTQSPSNAAGGLLEVRHIWNPLMGIEATYSFSRANEAYSYYIATPPCPSAVCGGPTTITASVPANAHEVTADWVVSLPLGNLKPFALAGYGLLLDVPTTGNVTATTVECPPDGIKAPCMTSTGSIPTRTEAKGVFQYGAGVDWTVLPHIGLRFQYRGNVYKAAALTKVFTSTDQFTQDAEPAVGIFIRF